MDDAILDGSIFGPGQPCFGCAPDHPAGLRLTFRRDGDVIETRFVPPDRMQGPPGIMHGGLVATLGDELGAWTVIGLLDKFAFTAEMSCRFKGPVRIGREVIGRGRIVKPGSRVVGIEVRLEQEGAEVYTSELKFVVLDRAGAERLLGGPLPSAWERFAR
ncbi:MAG: PaaI family thioesterase [Sandaracinaceae bacterium]